MNNHAFMKILKRATFVAVAASIIGCGEVTSRAVDGGGGEAGAVTVSTGGAAGERLIGTGSGGAVTGTGGAVVSTGGVAPGTGGAAGSPVGIDAGATGGTVVTIDAGASDGASACPRTLRTNAFGQGVQPTTVGGTSVGITQVSGSSTGGGPNGADWVDVLKVNLSGQPDSSNPLASSSGSIMFPVTQDCNGIAVDTDVGLQGYSVSFWVFAQGLSCDAAYLPVQWRVGVVSGTGTTFPWGAQMGNIPMAACSGQGVTVQWDTFPAGARGHALVLQFVDAFQQPASGLIDVSDIALTFKP